jgi:DNA-binding NarL/FixJ family response regulator
VGNIGTGEGATVVVGGRCDAALVAACAGEGLQVMAALDAADDVRRVAGVAAPSVVLLDSDVVGGALRLADEIVAGGHPVALRTDVDDEVGLFAALAAGVSGLVGADDPPASVARVAAVVAAGGIAIPRRVQPALLAHARSFGGTVVIDAGDRLLRLTPREWEVLLLLRQGRTTSEIAARLYVSKPTVRTFVASLLHQAGVANRDEVVHALRHARLVAGAEGERATREVG